MKISVIVTTWGCEPWTAACRTSVRAARERVESRGGRARTEVEVIEVCDGSGVWNARNEGLRRATGDWLAFVDGDDEIDAAWLEVIAENAERGDLVKARLDRFDGRPRTPGPGFWQACAFRRDVIPPDGFPPYGFGEDKLFLLRCLRRSKRTVDVDRIVYHYRPRAGSAVRSETTLARFLSKRDYARDWMRESSVRSNAVAYDGTFYLTLDLFRLTPRPWDAWCEGLERLKGVEKMLPWPCRTAVRVCRAVRWHWVTWLLMYLPARVLLKVAKDD